MEEQERNGILSVQRVHGIFPDEGRLIRKTCPRLCEEPSLEFIRGILHVMGRIEEVVCAYEWRAKLV